MTSLPHQIVQDVNIRSKYFNKSQERKLIVSPRNSKIAISSSGDPHSFKQFHIGELQNFKTQGNSIQMTFNNGRTYQIESSHPQVIKEAIQQTKNIDLSNKFVQQNVGVAPKTINYYQAFNPMKAVFSPMQMMTSGIAAYQPHNPILKNMGNVKVTFNNSPPKNISPKKDTADHIIIPAKNYSEAPYFINPENWKKDEKTTNYFLLNQQWKSNTSKIIGFVIKKFFTTGSFMGISFPTFAMKPESILETYAKSIGCAPKLFKNVKNPLQRMKKFICFIFTVSLLQLDINKPFNPIIGQTFQAQIAGGKYSAEQVCHHPPISGFLFQGEGYKIYSSIELSASIGMNSGQGRFMGDLTVEFQDGYWIKGRIPNGELSGFVVGETQFQVFGGAYAYDSNNTVCTYQMTDKHLFEGFIGTLNPKYQDKFKLKLKDNDRFIKFTAYSRDKYATLYSFVTVKYATFVAFDNQIYFDFNDKKNLPYIPQKISSSHQLLKSDSSLRLDIQLRKFENMKRSQQEKQVIENEQRRYRKLREKYSKK